MELGQATGERILQLLASEEMLQRLMELQRTRTVEQRVMDLQTRRALHDDILPTLHLAVLQLNGATQQSPVKEALHSLTDTHRQIAALLTNTQPAPARAPDPCNLVHSLRTLVDSEFAHHFAEVHWHDAAALPVDGAGSEAASGAGTVFVDALTGEVVVGAAREVMRNAALHGRGRKADFPLCLDITLRAEDRELVLAIQDNGVGIDAMRHVTSASGSGNSSGSGSGLALHSTLLAMIGGYLTVEPLEARGTLATITVERGDPR
jgi:anti-sigma regulatory factor (Ser/Thr protein kinase)